MRALYTAATGMSAQQVRIDNIANNLANVSTTGFKKSRESFEDLMYQSMPVGAASRDDPKPTSVDVGTGTRLVGITKDFRPGEMAYTGNELDLAIGSRGFFVFEGPGGVERYSRDGRFLKNGDGELVNSSGLGLDPNIQIPDDASSVVIAQDGTVQVTFSDNTDLVTVGTIQMVDFVNPAGLKAVGGNMFMRTPESGEPIIMDPSDGFVNLQQGFIENSNVDVAEELINMIVAQRSFELTSKVVETADQTMQVVNNLKR
jgi:flagellar basal-body rod protein FlgG